MIKVLAAYAATVTTALAPPAPQQPTTIAIEVNWPRVTVTVEGENGTTVQLQESIDLQSWTTITTHKFKANAPLVYTVEETASRKFYRAVDQ